MNTNQKSHLFRHPILERLTRTHIAVPLLIFCCYSLALLFWTAKRTTLSFSAVVFLFFSGVVLWTLVEYMVHRFLFHRAEGTNFQYTVHGVHHAFPKEKDRLAMPPLVSIAVATILLWLGHAMAGGVAFALLAGFIAGYAIYLGVHYAVHVFPPPNNFLRRLWINHGVHHHKNAGGYFGVSSPLWDYVFGTMPKPKP